MKKNVFLTMVMALMTAVAAFSCGKMDETTGNKTDELITTIKETILTEKVLTENVIVEDIVEEIIEEVEAVEETLEATIEEIEESEVDVVENKNYGPDPTIEAMRAYKEALNRLDELHNQTIDDTYEQELEYNSQVNIYFGRK